MEFKDKYELRLGSKGIFKIGGLDYLKDDLRILDLNNNEISVIEGLENLVNLEHLDLTANNIKNMLGLRTLKSLVTLGLCHNLIYTIQGIEFLSNLKRIGLYCNTLKKISEVSLKHIRDNNIFVSMAGELSDLEVVE